MWLLGYEMSDNFHERTRLMAISQWIGQLAWMIVPWFWVIIYSPSIYKSAPEGARNLSIWVGLLCLILGIIPAIFCKERALPTGKSELKLKDLAKNIKNFFAGIVQTAKCKPFLQLCGSTFLVFNGFQISCPILIFYNRLLSL